MATGDFFRARFDVTAYLRHPLADAAASFSAQTRVRERG